LEPKSRSSRRRGPRTKPAKSRRARKSRIASEPGWLRRARRLQAIAQDGLTYAKDPYDLERYELLQELAVEFMAEGSGAELEHLRALFARETGPATPKVDVRAVVFHDDEILLVKEPEDGLWSPPGGWADVGESPAEATVREVHEESGYRVRTVRFIALYDRDRHGHPPIPYHVYKLVFLCEILDEAPSPGANSTGVGFFAEEEIPELSLTRVTPAQVKRFFEHYHQPELPADFD
jgi:ADP-ribose pyrophosphatase YjhB (NUDIX family)